MPRWQTKWQTKQNQQQGLRKTIAVTMGLLYLTIMPLLANPIASASPISQQFTPSNASSKRIVDHKILDQLLEAHIQTDSEGLNRVNYKTLKVKQPQLQTYLQQLQAVKATDLNKAEQFAFWANLYNAVTLDVVLTAYPVKSIRDIDISPGLFSNGPWGKKLVRVENTPLSLDDIEHKILRVVFKDPRVHYAVNCASIGCPNLRKQAFTGPKLEQQLEAAATAYVNSNRGLKITNGRIEASKIYSWFRKDFGKDEKAVLDHLQRYANPSLKAKLQQATSIRRYHYDWNLNDTAR